VLAGSLLAPLLAHAACVPDRDENESLVTRPRVIAIQMEPAEVAPRQALRLRALYAGGDESDVDWAFCAEQKPLSELGPIAKSCLAPDGSGLAAPFATGLEASGSMPADACRLFGPDRPPPKPNEPAGRPVDADPSGGYYQPIGVFDYAQGQASLFEARVSCSLPGVTRAQFTDFQQRYVRNVNPQIDAVEAVLEGEVVPLESDRAVQVRAGQELSLRVWTAPCGAQLDAAARCGGAEPYLYFDLGTRTLVTRTETLSAAWFATAGRFHESRTGLDTADDGSLGRNVWTAPREPGPVTLWVVLRDDRGGVTWQSYPLEIE
jgi:hypothetical protein